MNSTSTQRSHYISSLPARPYCTNVPILRLLIRDKTQAITYALIQHNAPLIYRWLVFDVDAEDAYERAEARHCPSPTFIALNPKNGHGHIAYRLETPVSAFQKSSRQALRFYEDVYRGLATRLGADHSYSGFISKNPLSKLWTTDWQATIPYRLDTLNDYLERSDKLRVNEPTISCVGRNVSLFNEVRSVAYAECLKFKREGKTLDDFAVLLLGVANAKNLTYHPSLSSSEVSGIVRSTAKWVWQQFTFERFSAIQRTRAQKRWAKSPTLTHQRPWDMDGVSRATWYRRKPLEADKIPLLS